MDTQVFSRRLSLQQVAMADATAQVFHHTLRHRTWRGPVGGETRDLSVTVGDDIGKCGR